MYARLQNLLTDLKITPETDETVSFLLYEDGEQYS